MPPKRPVVDFHHLAEADLVLDRGYAGGHAKNAGDDPLAALLPVGNQGGFRYKGSVTEKSVRVVVLYTSGVDPDWPDAVDPETGDFTYYGDNKSPGAGLHETRRQGNVLLRDIFTWARQGPRERALVPPILLFQKTGVGRQVTFRGLLAPGSPRLSSEEELVAIWRTTQEHRFQNYRAHFTVLSVDEVPRAWLNEILSGDPLGAHCPQPWRDWVSRRHYSILRAPRTLHRRTTADQYPTARRMPILEAVHSHFSANPIAFEHFAADLWLASDPNVVSVDVTRPSRDGGRDALGHYAIGPATDSIRLSFALEAKCLRPGGGGVSTRMISRLVSRIKHREFGVLVTTAHIGLQPYQEVRDDGHPIAFITGRDIVDILAAQGLRTPTEVATHLRLRYPINE